MILVWRPQNWGIVFFLYLFSTIFSTKYSYKFGITSLILGWLKAEVVMLRPDLAGVPLQIAENDFEKNQGISNSTCGIIYIYIIIYTIHFGMNDMNISLPAVLMWKPGFEVTFLEYPRGGIQEEWAPQSFHDRNGAWNWLAWELQVLLLTAGSWRWQSSVTSPEKTMAEWWNCYPLVI